MCHDSNNIQEEKQEESSTIKALIISPYPGCELLGNFELLNTKDSYGILYTDSNKLPNSEGVKNEALNLKKVFNNIIVQFFSRDLPLVFLRKKESKLYFPDPTLENEPTCRQWGAYGEKMLRDGYDVYFYSINMKAPYIHMVEEFTKKKSTFDNVYESQRGRWNMESFIYEGRCKWLL